MTTRVLTCRALAYAALDADEWRQGIEARLNAAVDGISVKAFNALSMRLRRLEGRPSAERVFEMIRADVGLWENASAVIVRRWAAPSPCMSSSKVDARVPALSTVGEVARFLALPIPQLMWLADPRSMNRSERLSHYRTRWLPKRRGGRRLLEAPKGRLKSTQRTLLRGVLDLVPPHPAARGFVRGHDVLDHALAHAGRRWVLKLDLADFFPHVGRGRVCAIFAALGYPPRVAQILASLCTTMTPSHTLHGAGPVERALFGRRHLPQGAPTSPMLANLAAWRLDVRLSGLADKADLTYTRYADDLAFSGERVAQALVPQIASIAMEEGFPVQFRKTRRMGRGQRQEVGGRVVNAKPAVRREDYDRLRATLHRCALNGPSVENRSGHPDFRAHLRGRIAWIGWGHPRRLAKLLGLYKAIDFDVD